MKTLLVTGGAGFIGSNFTHYILENYPLYRVVVYDKLTYAGNPDNLRHLEDNPRYSFVRGDICDMPLVDRMVQEQGINIILNFAAETHVDRSILEPGSFIQTDIYGTYVLLEATKKFGLERMVQISTDEVYGEVTTGSSVESDPLRPRSPYAASKAGGDLICLAYYTTYGTPVVITRGSNSIGPYQYPEKVVPLFITNALDDLPLPLYGDGLQMRDYQYVIDHCEGIDTVLHKGKIGEIYNVGSGVEIRNIDMAKQILRFLKKPKSLIRYVEDRPGHDRRYSLDTTKLQALGWRSRHTFQEALEKTVKWYKENEWWWRKIKSGEYKVWYERQYGKRKTIAP
ncbi:MAG TPA: dTDP-glucose 4,6-dehydratase [Chloroflexi bacterium]|nr:dTDP-glucose 4,6-dehydratase [Chloroflexota bacterium]